MAHHWVDSTDRLSDSPMAESMAMMTVVHWVRRWAEQSGDQMVEHWAANLVQMMADHWAQSSVAMTAGLRVGYSASYSADWMEPQSVVLTDEMRVDCSDRSLVVSLDSHLAATMAEQLAGMTADRTVFRWVERKEHSMAGSKGCC